VRFSGFTGNFVGLNDVDYTQDDGLQDCNGDGAYKRYQGAGFGATVYVFATRSSGTTTWTFSTTVCGGQALATLETSSTSSSILDRSGSSATDATSAVITLTVTECPTVGATDGEGSDGGSECVVMENFPTVTDEFTQDSTLEDCGGLGFKRYAGTISGNTAYLYVSTDNRWVVAVASISCDASAYLARSDPFTSTGASSALAYSDLTFALIGSSDTTSGVSFAACPTEEDDSEDGEGEVEGDPHVLTMDGLRYDFQGSCSYVLSQSDADDVLPFRVVARMWSWGKDISYTRNLLVEFGTHKINLFQRNYISVNGSRNMLPPFIHDDFSITWVPDMKHTCMLKTNFGLKVMWTGKYKSNILLPQSYRGKVSGLLGNFDGNPNNDLKMPNGRPGTPCEIGEAWKYGDSKCISECLKEE